MVSHERGWPDEGCRVARVWPAGLPSEPGGSPGQFASVLEARARLRAPFLSRSSLWWDQPGRLLLLLASLTRPVASGCSRRPWAGGEVPDKPAAGQLTAPAPFSPMNGATSFIGKAKAGGGK